MNPDLETFNQQLKKQYSEILDKLGEEMIKKCCFGNFGVFDDGVTEKKTILKKKRGFQKIDIKQLENEL